MAIITVTTTADVVNATDGQISLREAVAQANSTATFDTVQFAAAIEGQTLVLTGGELAVTQDMRIDGGLTDNGPDITISGGGLSRVLNIVGAGTDVKLNDLVLANSDVYGVNGAGILLGGGSLKMDRCTVRGGSAGRYDGDGGGIAATSGSRLTISDSIFTENDSWFGGAITGSGSTITVRNTQFLNNYGNGAGGAIGLDGGSSLLIEDSVFIDNETGFHNGLGGAICVFDSTAVISRSTFTSNFAQGDGGAISGKGSEITISQSEISNNVSNDVGAGGGGGGVSTYGGILNINDTLLTGNVSHFNLDYSAGGCISSLSSITTVMNSTIVGNRATSAEADAVGGIFATGGSLTIRNSTITGNSAEGGGASIGGLLLEGAALDIGNSIVAGNSGQDAPDLFGTLTLSNGHNVFGSAVDGNVPGDLENVAPGLIFAALDPTTGGGLIGANGTVPLRNHVTNPALGGGDLLAALATDYLGTARPRPAISLPDLGATESSFAPSKVASANNDVLTGTSSANTIAALAGNDYVRGLGGGDGLSGGDGSDLLDGGPGNDTLNGGAGYDLALFGGSSAVVVDLSGAADTAKRGSETDTLISVEAAIGSSAADRFLGDIGRNFFQGAAGKDTYVLGSGRDLVDIDVAGHSGPSASKRDVVTDFVHLADHLDLSGIDADVALAGNQGFRFIGTAALGTKPGAVGYFTSGGNTIVQGSTDTDTAAEFQIELAGLVPLSGDDFYL